MLSQHPKGVTMNPLWLNDVTLEVQKIIDNLVAFHSHLTYFDGDQIVSSRQLAEEFILQNKIGVWGKERCVE
jgi:hypothetical protein